jgi:NAD(P)-dependent dehydrogenase (short-subunit alcohol dehydrogenase family)
MNSGPGRRLENASVLVIGGSFGIGLATASLARREGARVTIASRSREKLDAAVSRVGAGTDAYLVDVEDPASVESLFARVGRFDHLVVTATWGGNRREGDRGAQQSESAALAVRLFGAIDFCRLAASRMSRSGSITLFSGTAMQRPLVFRRLLREHVARHPELAPVGPPTDWTGLIGSYVWAWSMSVTETILRGVAAELAPLRVNSIVPGVVDSGRDRGRVMDAEFIARLVEETPLGRQASVDEIADAVLFVMGNTFITGQTVVVDGGWTLVH